MLRFIVLIGVPCAATLALAQGTPPRPDPLDAQAAVPRIEHRSALARYRSSTPAEPGDWRAANERVNRIGGWRSYAREAAAPEPAGSAPATTDATSATNATSATSEPRPSSPQSPPAAPRAPAHKH